MSELPFRQIHLDFHTAPQIGDVGSLFDPEVFVKTLKDARVNSINVFAKCHHGMSYYPTKVGVQHPGLKGDLLGSMLKVLHREGIAAPIYFPVGWEEISAENANWLEVNKDGVLGTIKPFEDRNYKWRKLCLNKSDYIDFILAQSQELIDLYQVDGLWYDIIFQKNCVCTDCQKSMKALGLDPQNEAHVKRHDLVVLNRFMDRVSAYLNQRLPKAMLFFNGNWAPDGGYDPEVGVVERSKHLTHMEIESLPSGIWGYNHFPLYVNYHNRLPRETLGMNGKFHTAWGDHGSLRNQEALEFECFRMIMNGSKCCIGDQLHPRGVLDPAVYRRIGKVYSQIAEREPWCTQSRKVADIGVVMAKKVTEGNNDPDEGVMRMLMELHHSFDFIDVNTDFSSYKVLILPDLVWCDEALAAKLSTYVKNGGKVIASHQSGLDRDGKTFRFAEAGIDYQGANPYKPSYFVLREGFAPRVDHFEYAAYEVCSQVTARPGTEILADAGQPYFNRTYDRFCSHMHFPFDKLSGTPAVVQNGGVIYLAHPLFTDYIQLGVRVYRDVFEACLNRLYTQPLLKSDLPPTAEVSLRRQGTKTIVHLLHYIAEKKSRKMDIVDTRIPLYGHKVSVRLDKAPRSAMLQPTGEALSLTFHDGYAEVTIPRLEGHAMVVLE